MSEPKKTAVEIMIEERARRHRQLLEFEDQRFALLAALYETTFMLQSAVDYAGAEAPVYDRLTKNKELIARTNSSPKI